MKRYSLPLVVLAVLTTAAFTFRQDPNRIDAPKLREMIVNLGYTVNDLSTEPGKEKYEFTITTGGFDIPIAAEISASKNYLWLTAFLGAPPAETSEKNAAMLKQNFKVQPTLFYITEKGNLMMGLPCDNRDITPDVLRRNATKLAEDVAKTSDIWGSE